MKYFLQRVEEELVLSVSKHLGIRAEELSIEKANPKFGADLAMPFFSLAGKLGKSPQEIALDAQDSIEHEAIAKTDVISGYLNIWLSPSTVAKGLAQDLQDTDNYGETHEGEGKTVVVDYIGLNLSKPFSVGHLRPTVQGAALINLYKALGYEVIGDSHIGDWGTPFGMWVIGFKKWGNDEALEKDGAYELGRLYVKFREEAKSNEGLIDEAKAWLKKLEAGYEQAIEYKDKFSKISLEHMNTVLARLKITPDQNLSESFYITEANKLVDELVESGVALRQEDGSVIVQLNDYGIETPILLQKSDGSLLYATTDLQTIKHRKETWNPEEIIYSVGGEQQFHFKQVFALADKLGYSMKLIHAWFGTIDELDENGKRGKMSSRKNTALLENLLDKAEEVAREKITDEEVTNEDIKKIALGAVKFSDFAQSRRTNILFDWDTMFSLQGFSGPYVQYAAVRVGSILSKLETEELKFDGNDDYDWKAEASLINLLAEYPSVVQEAAKEYEPHKIAQYSFDLAKELNKYYENVSVSRSERTEREARVKLLYLLRSNFEHALGLLGIEVPSKM